MTAAAPSLAEQYTVALQEYLRGSGEAALSRAYDLGREALGSGLGVLDIATIHRHAVNAAVLRGAAAQEGFSRAAEFFSESLGPFEMTFRGFVEANARLQVLNRTLHDDLALRSSELKVQVEALSQAEEQLRQSQKMEAIGKLAGGVAHDFNNMLSVILSYSDMILSDLTPGDRWREELQEIRGAGERAASLTRQLLAFSRQQVLDPKIVDLNSVVTGMDKMLRRLIGEDIELVTRPARDLRRVKVDTGQIEQVLMNLVVNARDAMPHGGSLTIETANVELDEMYAREHLDAVAGPHVLLAVSDTGFGMDKATQARMFEPFFTTKPMGVGSGLGLSTVFGIVRQSGGNIWVYSEPNKGTAFKVYFPSTDRTDAVTAPPAPPSRARGTEVILLVEDEEQVRAVVRRILVRAGYQVLEARDGTEALRVSEQHAGPIQLLLTDVVMPQMSGRQLADRLVSARPELKVIYTSGYTDDSIVHHGILDAGVVFLQKPITADALTKKVRGVLD